MSVAYSEPASFPDEELQRLDVELGERLVAEGKLERADRERALRLQRDGEDRLGPILVRLGLVSERHVAEVMASELALPWVNPEDYPDIPVLADQVPAKFLKHNKVLPLAVSGDEVVLAMADPLDRYVVNALQLISGKRVACRVGVPSEIEAAFERLYGTGKTQMDQIVDNLAEGEEAASEEDLAHLKDLASEAPVIRIVNLIIQRAVVAQASDIHIEPFENHLKVRYRIDGMLREVEAPPARLCAAVISRIKIMAKLDIAERRLPQDGRLKVRVQGKELDLRISTVPTLHGESVVMRLLHKESIALDFDALGFTGQTLERFLHVLHKPHGIILVTGPTGSGKTTTLYTAMSTLNDPTRKILTVEDPIEYQLVGINQIQVKPRIDMTFARALRAIVRQDPDVIMIGEMRDLETAKIAVQSAMTGHLVLSTLHTNDAASSITRLLDMGVEGYLVTSTVNGVLAQRLARTLCSHCRRPYEALPELVEKTKLDRWSEGGPVVLYEPVGCEHCGHTGYRGRAAIMEMLVMSDAIARLVISHADARQIAEAAVAEGMRTMYEAGLHKALAGVTSIEEVLRVTQEM